MVARPLHLPALAFSYTFRIHLELRHIYHEASLVIGNGSPVNAWNSM